MATLAADISATTKTITLSGDVSAAVPGRLYAIDDEVILLEGYEPFGTPVGGDDHGTEDLNTAAWRVKRGQGGSTPATHSSGVTVYGAALAVVKSATLAGPVAFAIGDAGLANVGAANGTATISGVAGGAGEAGATLIIAGGGGDGNGETPYHGARVIFNANADDGTAGMLELEGGDSDGLVAVRLPKFTNVPTSDPVVTGQVWNDGGTLKISAGA